MTYLAAAAMVLTLVVGTGMPATASTTQVFSSNDQVDTWDPILPSSADPNWPTTVCVPAPAVGLDAAWVNPHLATHFPSGTHPWEGATAGFTAAWINAWANIDSTQSGGPGGHNWTKYSTQVSGTGDFVLNLLADNCSWIYLDGTLVGFQDAPSAYNIQARRYPVHLTGTHTLAFLIFDGGGSAGGMYRLETNTTTVFPTTTTATFGPGPFVSNGSAFTATATVLIGSVIQSVSAVITYTGDCVNPGTSCTATATYAGDATHGPSSGAASITIVAPVDTTPPVVTVPSNVTSEATSPSGAAVPFSASALDNVDGAVATTCTSASGSTFPLGTTTVTCSAKDRAGNIGSASFSVTVRDTTPPTLSLPANMTTDATSPGGAMVTFTASATDLVDLTDHVVCTPVSGATFAIGATTVHCSATDAHGNPASGSFMITVRGAAAQLESLAAITCAGVGPGNSLCAKTHNIQSKLTRAPATACNQLAALLSEIKAQTGKSLTTAQAAQLTDAANRIGAVIPCS